MYFLGRIILVDEEVKQVLADSVAQMKVWLAEQGVEAESLGKKDVAKLMDEVEGDVKDALLLRQ